MLVFLSYLVLITFFFIVSKYINIQNKFIIFIISYVVIISIYNTYDAYLSYKLNFFDLDGDGIFSGNEICKEQEEAMKKVIFDTSRTFIWISGIFYSILYTLVHTTLRKKSILSNHHVPRKDKN
jgi:hypothetical protein